MKDDPESVFASTFVGIHRSDDRGVTWHRLPSHPSSDVAVSRDGKKVYSFGLSDVYRSSDGGVTFRSFTSGLPSNGHVTAIAIDPQNPEIVYVSLVLDGVYRSVDGGEHWTAANAGLAGSFYRSIVIDPSNRSTLYLVVLERSHRSTSQTSVVATGTSIYKSTNAGMSWSALATGPATRCWSVDVSDSAPSTIVAGTDRSVLRSTNGGTTWTGPRLSEVEAKAAFQQRPIEEWEKIAQQLQPRVSHSSRSATGIHHRGTARP